MENPESNFRNGQLSPGGGNFFPRVCNCLMVRNKDCRTVELCVGFLRRAYHPEVFLSVFWLKKLTILFGGPVFRESFCPAPF